MKADWNLIRQIVLAVEKGITAELPHIPGHSPDEVGYHAHLLIVSGLAEGVSVRNAGHQYPCDFISNLTMTGHEFVELVRDEIRWRAAMAEAQARGPVTLAILQSLLTRSQRNQSGTSPERSIPAWQDFRGSRSSPAEELGKRETVVMAEPAADPAQLIARPPQGVNEGVML